MTPYQSGLLSRENLQYIGNNSEGLPVYLDRRTGKERVGSTPISAKASVRGPSVTEWKYNAWLAAHPEDADTNEGKQRALDFAGGKRQMSDAEMNKSAYSMAQKEVKDMAIPPPNPQLYTEQRAKQIVEFFRSNTKKQSEARSSKEMALEKPLSSGPM